MASIARKNLKTGTGWYIVYAHYDENGVRKRKWVTCRSLAEAEELKPDVEAAEAENRIYTRPRYDVREPLHYANSSGKKCIVLRELVELYVKRHCAEGGWEARTASANKGILRNYVYPLIGDEPIKNITPYYMQQYYEDLQTRPAVKPRNGEIVTVSARTLKDIQKILHPAFNEAVRLGLIASNPTDHVKLPRMEHKKRKQWTKEEVIEGLKACTDPLLLLMISMMYDVTLRSGELLGTKWEDLKLPEDGSTGVLTVRNELARLSKEEVEETGTVIHFRFPDVKINATTSLYLKAPKNEKSNRDNFLSQTVVEMLLFMRQLQEARKAMIGDAFQDYGLVFCQDNGRPISDKMLTKRFQKYLNITSMKEIEFYSLRHSGATSQMELSGNDIKAVQANMGHTTSDMLMKVYLSPIERKRREIAEQLDKEVFSEVEWKPLFEELKQEIDQMEQKKQKKQKDC